MYRFKTDKYLELLDGRTAEWLARELGYSATTMSLIFNARKNVKKGRNLFFFLILKINLKLKQACSFIC